MSNNSYNRSFIILSTLDSGYSLDSRKEPAGYCKMEIRKNQGRLQVYVQDMKPVEAQQGIYDIILVSGSQGVQPIKLTSIQIPDNGKGEYEITFDPSDVHESGHNIGDFHGLAVAYRSLEGRQTLHYPLVGYSDKRVQLDWKGTVTNELSSLYNIKDVDSDKYLAVEYKEVEPSGNVTEEDSVEDFAEDSVEDFAEDSAEDFAEDSVEDFTEDALLAYTDGASEMPDEESSDTYESENPIYNIPAKEDDLDVSAVEDIVDSGAAVFNDADVDSAELESVENDFTIESVDIEQDQYELVDDETFYSNLEGASHQPAKEHYDSHDAPYSMNYGTVTYWDKVKDYFNNLFEGHKKVCPFDEPVGEVDWIRVDHRSEPMNSFYYRPVDVYTNSAHLDHYLVGLERKQGKVSYVIYGIPGVYSAVPPMSMHGFSRWLPVKNAYGAGYWMLYIDALTGNIAFPY